MDEPSHVVDWALRFAGLEAEIEADEIKKAQENNGRR